MNLMNDSMTQATNDTEAAHAAAQRIVRHFQSKGFTRITEALIIQIHHIAGDRAEIEEAFEAAQEQDKVPPINAYFSLHPYGHFSEFRSFDEAKVALKSDFSLSLINEIPRLFFELAPVVGDDPLAQGTKYDAILKLSHNVDGNAVVILLNDPDASFIDYVGTHPGADWHKIMGEFRIATTSLVETLDFP
jgi:hypothetical protein